MTEPASRKQGGIKDIALGRADIYRLAPNDLHVKEDWNSREECADLDEHIDMLAQSIAAEGVKRPLVVYWEGGRAFVSDGHCRRRAVLRAIEVYGADIKSVPVMTEDRYSSEADRIFSQIIQNSGKPLTPFEQGKVYKRLLGLGWTENDIASKAGLSRTRVSQVLNLQAAPEPVQDMVRSGTISASLATQVMNGAEGPQQATKELQQAVEKAKAAGKTRATAKHLPNAVPRGGLKAELRDVIEGAEVTSRVDLVDLTFTATEYARLRALLGMPKEED